MDLSYIITHRGASPDRTANLYAVINHLVKNCPTMEIIVVEQDTTPSGLQLPSQVKHIFVYNPGLFNRSWGFNVGFRESSYDIFAFGDNDIILNPEAIEEAHKQCPTTQTVSPYAADTVIDITAKHTEAYLQTGIFPVDIKKNGHLRRGTYAGGIIFMTRAAFQLLGGWDERIRGWGGEDDHMTFKIEKLIGKKNTLKSGVAIHLYHAKPQTNTQPHYKKNVEIMKDVLKKSKEDLTKICQNKIKIIGNIHLYFVTETPS